MDKNELNIIMSYAKDHPDEVQGWIDEELKRVIKEVHKYQFAHRKIVEEYIDSGLLPSYSAGFISLDKQFSTLGVNGHLEAAEFLGYDTSNANEEYMGWLSKLLGTFKELNKEGKKTYGVKYNTECVPAENLANKNAKWDKKDGLFVPRNVYSSYSYDPSCDMTSIIDKFKMHGGAIANSMDGGQALHLNLAQLPDKEFFLWLRQLACDEDTSYWTTNVKTTICKDCGHIDLHTLDTCPKCGSKNLDFATRIIGYCTKVSTYSKARQEEESTRVYH